MLSCGLILEGEKPANVRVSCQAVGRRAVAIGCCIPLCWGAQGTACLHLQAAAKSRSSLPQTKLSCGLFALLQYPKPLCANKDGPCLCELSSPEQGITNKATNLRRRNYLCAQLGGFRSPR